MTVKNHKSAARRLVTAMLAMIMTLGMITAAAGTVHAAAQTVTLKYGSQIWFGDHPLSGHTSLKWVTHIDGEAVDTDEIPGVSRSYAYCVQPMADPPPEGTYNISIIDDDDTGRISKMRKLVYYLPGSYGYTKVTKSKWFSGYSMEDAYAIGHTALSWIYDNYKEDDTVWGGAPSDFRAKTKAIVSDLANLPDPPESFEVFWVRREGRQDVFGAFYNTEYGKVKVAKSGDLTGITNGNKCYSLGGAQFTLYTNQTCTDRATLKNGNAAVITTKADGSSDPVELETGDYYIKETKAPVGYALDPTVKKITVNKDATYTYSCKDMPISDPIDLLLTKIPAGYPHNYGEGDATLAGAVYEFKYYDGQYNTAAQAESTGTLKATWYLVTDASGKISGQNPVTASGYTSSAFYRDKDNKICYPLGTYVICEVKAPAGYLVNSAKLINHVTEDGTDKTPVRTYNESIKGDDTIIRGGVKLAKIDNDLDEAYAQGDATLAGAEFTIYNQSAQTVMVGGKEIAKGAAALTITTNADGIAASDAHALPYGSYLVKETKPSKGYLLNTEWSRAFTVRQDGVIVDLSGDKVREAVIRGGVQIIKRDKELKKSEALGGAHLDGIVMTIKNVSGRDVVVRKDLDNKTDKVDWKKLESRKALLDDGTIRRVPTGKDVGKITVRWNEEKKAYTAETLADDLPYGTYTIRESKTNESYQRTDKTEHMFTIREDGVIVSYDDNSNEQALTFDDYVYRSDVQGTKIADSTSERFSYVPFKIISMTNGETHVVVTDSNGFFSTKDRRAAGDLDEDEDADTARKQNPFDDLLEAKDIKTADLKARKDDILHGVWFGTGELGNKAEMNSDFGALPFDSYILEEMPCEHNEGYTLQRFYFTVDQKSQTGFIDLETITDDVPEIGTTASVAGQKENVLPSKKITLNDRIRYKNLTRGEKYVAKGVLMDKATGKPVLDPNGKEITAEKEFTALLGTGWVNVTFTFDATSLFGKTTVVFEKVYDARGHITAKHEDIDDEDQTVTWKKPSIGTTLTGDKGAKTVVASEKTTLTDTIAYEGLDTTQWYIFEGTLMVKDTGDPLVEHGHEVTVYSDPFQPKEAKGEAKVTFTIDTTNLKGKELVAFETAYRLNGYKKGDDLSKTTMTKVAEHKDINDKGQTVKVADGNTPVLAPGPDTGDSSRLKFYAVLLGGALSALTAYGVREGIRSLKRRKEEMSILV